MLNFHDGRTFAAGAARYLYRPPNASEPTNRVLVRVQFETKDVLAVLDTGAPYAICAPEIAARLGIPSHADHGDGENIHLRTAYGEVHGVLQRMSLTFLADEGDDCTVEATVFVPPADAWPATLPSFIGMGGCLERLRFALDPAGDMLYFGEASAI